MTSICLLPRLKGIGGPAAFQARLSEGLQERGIVTHHDPARPDTDAILVIAGTRDLPALWQAKRRGVRIVQRLNGMNWTHKRTHTGIKHYLRAEMSNWLLSTIRRHFADFVVYQSQFTRQWWQDAWGAVKAPGTVVYNSVNLTKISPEGPGELPTDRYRLLLVEGHLGGGHELGFQNAAALARELQTRADRPVELMVAGDAPEALRERCRQEGMDWVNWAGVLPRDQIPTLDRSSHLFFPSELNAACPNSVIEALACGTPVVSFDTGAIRELVGDSGVVVPYGSDHWKLQPAVAAPLAEACVAVLRDLDAYQARARARAEAEFGLEKMVDAYLKALIP